jgi:hypothetical protein
MFFVSKPEALLDFDKFLDAHRRDINNVIRHGEVEGFNVWDFLSRLPCRKVKRFKTQ